MMQDIYKLLSEGERVTLECKKATKGVPSSLWDTYSAFANTYGGTILLGVVEHMDVLLPVSLFLRRAHRDPSQNNLPSKHTLLYHTS